MQRQTAMRYRLGAGLASGKANVAAGEAVGVPGDPGDELGSGVTLGLCVGVGVGVGGGGIMFSQ